MFEIDHQPWSNQQVLLTETLYDLNAKVTISAWPVNSDFLVIDYISSLAPEQYRITKLRIDRPRNANATEFTPTGHMEFPVAQNLFSEPIVIRVRATFLSTKDERQQVPATIVGYHQLRVLVSDKTRTTMPTRYKAIDARTLEIVNEIRQTLPQIDSQHLKDFTDALASIANFMGINLQQSRYKEGMKVSEADFQKDLLYHLRMRSGEDVQEAPRQAGGPIDIKFKSITIEGRVSQMMMASI